MNKDKINDLLYGLPSDLSEDADDLYLEDLSLDDIPVSKLEGLKKLLYHNELYISYRASCLLTNWNIEEGFVRLISLFSENKLIGLELHRIYGYDETYKKVLQFLISYWTKNSYIGNGEKARKKIYPYVCKIIEASNYSYFDISELFWLIIHKKFTEYVPYLLEHLTIILDDPKNNYWRIHDVLKVLRKVEPEKTNNILKSKNKKYSDFDL